MKQTLLPALHVVSPAASESPKHPSVIELNYQLILSLPYVSLIYLTSLIFLLVSGGQEVETDLLMLFLVFFQL